MAYSENRTNLKKPKRSNEDYLASSRSELINHLKTEIKKKPTHRFVDFMRSTIWSWIYHYFKSRFGKKYPYPVYPKNQSGVYSISSNKQVVISIASDWATDTAESLEIAQQMATHSPDFTIHVGDTYYVGAPPEIESNFTQQGAPWIRGSLGSFAVLGNHEMYARGDAFFELLLPTLGLKNEAGEFTGQKAGYFCLENESWRVIGLDTGYHSTGIPLLEFLPWFAPDCHLDKTQMRWLKEQVKIGDPTDKRGIVILTHHQPITAFSKEKEYSKPAKQLSSLFTAEKKILWLWGHEHKLSLFGRYPAEKPVTIYGRCIGNGGTPVETDGKHFKLSDDKKGYNSLVGFDKREQRSLKNTTLGYNGYAVIKLDGIRMTIAYHDSQNMLIQEEWTADIATGDSHANIQCAPGCQLTLANGKTWDDAVK